MGLPEWGLQVCPSCVFCFSIAKLGILGRVAKSVNNGEQPRTNLGRLANKREQTQRFCHTATAGRHTYLPLCHMLEALCHMAKTSGHMQIYWEHTTTARCDHTIGWQHITTGGRHMQMAAQPTAIRFKHIAAGPCYIKTGGRKIDAPLKKKN